MGEKLVPPQGRKARTTDPDPQPLRSSQSIANPSMGSPKEGAIKSTLSPDPALSGKVVSGAVNPDTPCPEARPQPVSLPPDRGCGWRGAAALQA